MTSQIADYTQIWNKQGHLPMSFIFCKTNVSIDHVFWVGT